MHFSMPAASREVDRTLGNRGRMHAALGDMIFKGEVYSALSEEALMKGSGYLLMLKPDYDRGMCSIS